MSHQPVEPDHVMPQLFQVHRIGMRHRSKISLEDRHPDIPVVAAHLDETRPGKSRGQNAEVHEIRKQLVSHHALRRRGSETRGKPFGEGFKLTRLRPHPQVRGRLIDQRAFAQRQDIAMPGQYCLEKRRSASREANHEDGRGFCAPFGRPNPVSIPKDGDRRHFSQIVLDIVFDLAAQKPVSCLQSGKGGFVISKVHMRLRERESECTPLSRRQLIGLGHVAHPVEQRVTPYPCLTKSKQTVRRGIFRRPLRAPPGKFSGEIQLPPLRDIRGQPAFRINRQFRQIADIGQSSFTPLGLEDRIRKHILQSEFRCSRVWPQKLDGFPCPAKRDESAGPYPENILILRVLAAQILGKAQRLQRPIGAQIGTRKVDPQAQRRTRLPGFGLQKIDRLTGPTLAKKAEAEIGQRGFRRWRQNKGPSQHRFGAYRIVVGQGRHAKQVQQLVVLGIGIQPLPPRLPSLGQRAAPDQGGNIVDRSPPSLRDVQKTPHDRFRKPCPAHGIARPRFLPRLAERGHISAPDEHVTGCAFGSPPECRQSSLGVSEKKQSSRFHHQAFRRYSLWRLANHG